MLNEHFISFYVLSHPKVLDVDMFTSTFTFIILREENGSKIIVEDLDWSRYRINHFEITNKISQP
jgi:hypothetical protein